MNISDEIYNISESVIERYYSDEYQEHISQLREVMSPKAFFNEVIAARINLGRQAGHTTTAKKLAQKYNSVTVIPNSGMGRYYDGLNTVCTLDINRCTNREQPRYYHLIIVDCSYNTNEDKLCRDYINLCQYYIDHKFSNPYPLVLMLG